NRPHAGLGIVSAVAIIADVEHAAGQQVVDLDGRGCVRAGVFYGERVHDVLAHLRVGVVHALVDGHVNDLRYEGGLGLVIAEVGVVLQARHGGDVVHGLGQGAGGLGGQVQRGAGAAGQRANRPHA